MEVTKILTNEYKLLAQGEYNANYSFEEDGRMLVLRVNHGSQMHLDNQISYEATAMKYLEPTGRIPVVHAVDDSEDALGNGALVMTYLPGHHLDYNNRAEMAAVAKCLADIHSHQVPENNSLIAPENSLKAILDECEEMLEVYLESDIPSAQAKTRLRHLLDTAWELIDENAMDNCYRCIINTELNSTNFLVYDGYARLVDWEKPLYGDPAQDIGHFIAPTTTFWKTDVVFNNETIDWFIDEYINAVGNRYDISGLRERIIMFATITCLRGMTWCAMAWVQYQNEDKELLNESTWKKLNQYLDEPFVELIENIIEKTVSNQNKLL